MALFSKNNAQFELKFVGRAKKRSAEYGKLSAYHHGTGEARAGNADRRSSATAKGTRGVDWREEQQSPSLLFFLDHMDPLVLGLRWALTDPMAIFATPITFIPTYGLVGIVARSVRRRSSVAPSASTPSRTSPATAARTLAPSPGGGFSITPLLPPRLPLLCRHVQLSVVVKSR